MTRAVSMLPLPLVEEWRPIPGHEGRYSASNAGRVRSEPRTEYSPCYPNGRTYKSVVLKTWMHENGYECVMLTSIGGGGRFHERIHRLVCSAFHGDKPTNRHEPNHINSVRTDNRPCNLEWVTRSENIQHAYDSGRRKPRANGKRNRLTIQQVRDIRRRYGKESRHALAQEYGIDLAHLWSVYARKIWRGVPAEKEGP